MDPRSILKGISEADDQKDGDESLLIPQYANGLDSSHHLRQQSNRNLIHSTADGDEISGREQNEMAKEMKAQMKRLRRDQSNEMAPFDDGYFNRFENGGAFSTDNEEADSSMVDLLASRSGKRQVSFEMERDSLFGTAGLRTKLGKINRSINRIREGLHEQSEHVILAELNQQLTDIQDQISDAENDVENKLEPAIGTLRTQNKRHQKEISRIKKENSDTIAQIEQLQKAQSTPRMLSMHQMATSVPLDAQPLDADPGHKQKHRRCASDATRSSRPYVEDSVHSEDTFAHFAPQQQYEDNTLQHPLPYHLNPGHVQSGTMPMTASAAAPGFDHEPTVIGAPTAEYHEGAQYHHQPLPPQQKRPLLSDNAVKIISGVVVFIGLVWIAHKWLSADKQKRSFPPPQKRAPRVRY